MGALLPVAVGLLTGLAVLVLLGAEAVESSMPGRLVRAAQRRALRLLRRLGASGASARVLGTRAGRALAEEVSGKARERGLEFGPGEAVAAVGCAIVLAMLLSAVLLASVPAGIVTGVALVALIVARDASARQRMRREASLEMPGIYRTLSVAMASGQTLAQAVHYVGSHGSGPASGVFARMSLRLRCGVSTEEAVGHLASELAAPGVELLATALVISHRTGSPLRELLLRSARLAERQGEFERLLSVKTAQVRLSVRIVCLLPVVMVGVLTLVSPDFQEGLLTPAGLGCVVLALALDGTALLIIRRMLRGVL